MARKKSKIKNSSTTASELWRNAGPSAFQLLETMLKSVKIWCTYLVINPVRLRTFWTPLVLLTHRTVDGSFKHIHSTCFQRETNCLTMNTTSYQCQQNSQCYWTGINTDPRQRCTTTIFAYHVLYTSVFAIYWSNHISTTKTGEKTEMQLSHTRATNDVPFWKKIVLKIVSFILLQFFIFEKT